MKFVLDIEQVAKIIEWKKTRPVTQAAMGEQFEYSFIPTGLGMIARVRCLETDEVLELSDSENW